MTDWNNHASENGSGRIDVTIGNVIPLENGVTMQVWLVKDGETKQERTKVFEKDKTEYKDKETISFDDIEPGTWELHISAKGFREYVQTMEMDGEIKSVEVYTDFLALPDRTYESGKLHPGVLLFGDMNGDGKLG